MLNVLFSTEFWYLIIGAVLLIVATILCIKYESARWVTGTVLTLVLLGSTVYSGFKLNEYYSADGGVYGYIENLLNNTSKSENKDDSVKIELSNIVFSATSNVDEYSATFILDDIFNFDSEKDYVVLVNGVPCANCESVIGLAESFVKGDFEYNFYAEDGSLILNDTLTIRVALHTNLTKVYVKTNGGSEAIKYWSSYVQKNKFDLDIKEINYSSSDIEISDGLIVDDMIHSVNYFVGETLVNKQVYKQGSNVEFVDYKGDNSYLFLGWSLDNKNVVDSLVVEETINLYAVFGKVTVNVTNLTKDNLGYDLPDSGSYVVLTNNKLSVNGGVTIVPIAVSGYKFRGLYLDSAFENLLVSPYDGDSNFIYSEVVDYVNQDTKTLNVYALFTPVTVDDNPGQEDKGEIEGPSEDLEPGF